MLASRRDRTKCWSTGFALRSRAKGSGPPVLCLHAIGHGGRDYETFSAPAARSLRGHTARLARTGAFRPRSRTCDIRPICCFASRCGGGSSPGASHHRRLLDRRRGRDTLCERIPGRRSGAGEFGGIGRAHPKTRSALACCFPGSSRPDRAARGGTKRYSHVFIEAYCPLRPRSISASASSNALTRRRRCSPRHGKALPMPRRSDHRSLAIAARCAGAVRLGDAGPDQFVRGHRADDSANEAGASHQIPGRPRRIPGATGAIRRGLRQVCRRNPREKRAPRRAKNEPCVAFLTETAAARMPLNRQKCGSMFVSVDLERRHRTRARSVRGLIMTKQLLFGVLLSAIAGAAVAGVPSGWPRVPANPATRVGLLLGDSDTSSTDAAARSVGVLRARLVYPQPEIWRKRP